MHALSENQLLLVLVALGVILLCGRAAGELARRVHQPEVLGQLVAGFVLGPSVLGALAPLVYRTIFSEPPVGNGLSLFSWTGAILLLLLAGMEVDPAILRIQLKTGALTALGSIGASLVAGTLFAWLVLGQPPQSGIFLGIVLSVTAVTVTSTILLERGVMRRSYAQVMLVAGVSSEVLVWVFVSVISSAQGSSPLLAAAESVVSALGVFLFMLTFGRRFTVWAMRRVTDATHITRGPISFVLVLTFLAGALTHAMHLHPLLGAFIVGVLLRGAPRVSAPLAQSVQTMTLGLFGPVFFVLAGMRVDLTQLGGPSAIITIILLLVVASLVKIGFGGLGARLGGLSWWEAASVGVGLNLKGGTDVIVAVVGSELGFLSGSLYTTYAVVAMLSVLISPPLLTFLSKKAPPSTAEAERLAREEMAERAYLQRVERVLTPVAPPLFPALVADVVACIATTKQAHNQVFDVTRLDVEHRPEREPASSNGRTPGASRANEAAPPAQRRADAQQPRDALAAAKGYDLVAIGARPPQPASLLSLGRLNDRIINDGQTDVLVVVSVGEVVSCGDANRILVPINGLEHSMAAIDVAACLARHNEAEVVLFHVARPLVATWTDSTHDGKDDQALTAITGVMRGLAKQIGGQGLRVTHRVRTSDDPGAEILREARRDDYQMIVLGATTRGATAHLALGATTQEVLTQEHTPIVLLVSH
jgi:Kef-type K+ transport system membrane component KefB/nucleotide-binding universal stress UspA family protein